MITCKLLGLAEIFARFHIVARYAQRLQIAFVVGATVDQRKDVVHTLGFTDLASCEAVHAQGVQA